MPPLIPTKDKWGRRKEAPKPRRKKTSVAKQQEQLELRREYKEDRRQQHQQEKLMLEASGPPRLPATLNTHVVSKLLK